MIRFSEIAGLIAALALFLGTLIAAQAFISHEMGLQSAELVEPAE